MPISFAELGVPAALVSALAEQGITTFKQLAELTDADVETIDANMPFSAEQIRGHADPGAEAVARLFERLSLGSPVA